MTRDLTHDERRRYWTDLFSLEGDWGKQAVRWLDDASLYCAELVEQGPSASREVRALFWIRLFGILDDTYPSIAELEKSHRAMHAEFGNPNEVTLASLAEDMLARVDTLRDALSPEEWIYVAYRRHREAHPFQKFIQISLRTRGGIKAQGTILGTVHTVEVMKAALRTVRATGDDPSVAARIAGQVSALLAPIRDAIEEYVEVQMPPDTNGQ